jgi:muconolactone delta-isomerase
MNQPATNPAQQLLQVPCTGVLVQLTVKPGINPQALMPLMPREVRDTVLLYLDGHISQWWSLCDQPGVLFLFNVDKVEEAQKLMASLPFVQENLVDLTFTRVGPLAPLRVLLNAATPARE